MISVQQLKDFLCKSTSLELQQILISSNHLFLYWMGSRESTRLTVPMVMRKKGLWVTYIDPYNSHIYSEEYIGLKDDVGIDFQWSLASNWRIIGESAGFAEPTVEAHTLAQGTEAFATVTSSGPDTNKLFNFDFYIPRGWKGDSAIYRWNSRSLQLGSFNVENQVTTWGDSINLTGQGSTYEWRGTELRLGTINAGEGTITWGSYVDLKGIPGSPGVSPEPNDFQIMRFKQSDTQPATPTGTSQNPIGWEKAPTAIGRWWMSVGNVSGLSNLVTSWSTPVQSTGLDGNDGQDGNNGEDGKDGNNGEDGKDGNTTEFRWAVNITPNIPPSLVNTDRNPSGWSTTVPSIGDSQFLWMIQATINPNSNTLVGTWSSPIRLTGESGPIGPPGAPGPAGTPGVGGPKGQVVYPAGIYDLNTTYTTDAYKAPYVLDITDPTTHGGVYYVLNRQMNWLGTQQGNKTPYQDYLASGTDASWIPMGMYEAIFTKLLIASNGLVGSAVFNGDYMFSQQGIDMEGNFSTDYQNFGITDMHGTTWSTPIRIDNNRTYQSAGNKVYAFKLSLLGIILRPNYTNPDTSTWNNSNYLLYWSSIPAISPNMYMSVGTVVDGVITSWSNPTPLDSNYPSVGDLTGRFGPSKNTSSPYFNATQRENEGWFRQHDNQNVNIDWVSIWYTSLIIPTNVDYLFTPNFQVNLKDGSGHYAAGGLEISNTGLILSRTGISNVYRFWNAKERIDVSNPYYSIKPELGTNIKVNLGGPTGEYVSFPDPTRYPDIDINLTGTVSTRSSYLPIYYKTSTNAPFRDENDNFIGEKISLLPDSNIGITNTFRITFTSLDGNWCITKRRNTFIEEVS